jgi:hypothetical protein
MEVILELSNTPHSSCPSDAELLVSFSQNARSLSNSNERGFPIHEIACAQKDARRFRLYFADAVEFIDVRTISAIGTLSYRKNMDTLRKRNLKKSLPVWVCGLLFPIRSLIRGSSATDIEENCIVQQKHGGYWISSHKLPDRRRKGC